MGAGHSKNSEDALQLLVKFDTIIVVDDSSSMTSGDRWQEAGRALETLATVASKYDSDGIEVRFLNSFEMRAKIQGAGSQVIVRNLFKRVQPSGMTPIGERLHEILQGYLKQYQVNQRIKPLNLIIITDGRPSDKGNLKPERVIVRIAEELDARDAPLSQIGIQFVQIGHDDEAKEFLDELDDGLKRRYRVRDIVDTTPSIPGQRLDLIKILTGGINRRVDNNGSQSVS